MNLPDTIRYEIKTGCYNNTVTRYLTPYSDQQRAMTVISENGIKVPFQKIITRADGISICPFCKVRYSGEQGQCTNKIQWYRAVDTWHDYRSPHHLQIGDFAKMPYDSFPRKVESTKLDDCATDTAWDLSKEFYEQTSFFEFVELVGNIHVEGKNLLQKFSGTLPLGTLNEYRIKLLENENFMVNGRLMAIENALRLVIDRLNQAGSCLTF
jgi:hypothetical protein